jgi:hypothetical protein
MVKRAGAGNLYAEAPGCFPNPPGVEVQNRICQQCGQRTAAVVCQGEFSMNNICIKHIRSGRNIRLQRIAVKAGVCAY